MDARRAPVHFRIAFVVIGLVIVGFVVAGIALRGIAYSVAVSALTLVLVVDVIVLVVADARYSRRERAGLPEPGPVAPDIPGRFRGRRRS